jgi:hypothetical protein
MLLGYSGHFGKRPVLPGGYGKPGRLLGIAIDFSKGRILATAVNSSKQLLVSEMQEGPTSQKQIAADWVEVVGSGVGIGRVQGCGLVPALFGEGRVRMRINFGGDSARPLRLAPPSEEFLPLALVAGEGSLWSKVCLLGFINAVQLLDCAMLRQDEKLVR